MKYAPNWTTIGGKKWRHVDFQDGGSQWTALNCLVLEKIAFFAFWRQTDGQTDRRLWCKPLSLHHFDAGENLGLISRSIFLLYFYRTMHMYKCGICRHAVSVRPSVTFVSCAKTNKDIFEIFSPSGSQAILVFLCKTGWRCSDGNPPNGGVECKGVW